MIKKESINALVESTNIIDIVSSYIDLKKSGSTYKARCPFHNEKTPSFSVSEPKQIFHCFGCGVGGNSLTFIRDIENISFVEAVENLAERSGFQLEYEKNSEFRQSNKLPILQTINSWFEDNLQKNRESLQYLISRGLKHSTIQKFQLGYAPSSYEILKFFQNEHINFKEAEDLGVVALNSDGRNYYSRFTKRVMFPIFSQNNKIIAFGGRTLGDHPAKYINSPATPYFNKSKTLYGYNFAKKSIYKTEKVHIVEGYLDVIMLHQAGVENVVAPLGTALTKEHIHILKKGKISINLAFDGDKAGVDATIRALDILMPLGINSSVTVFENGFDPADLVKDGKNEILKSILDNPQDSVKFYLQQIASKYDLKNPYEKDKAFSEAKQLISKIPKIIGNEYISYLADIFSIQNPETVFQYEKIKSNENVNFNRNLQQNISGLAELSIIRSIIDNPSYLITFLNELDENDFQAYKNEFQILAKGDLNNSSLQKLAIMDCKSIDSIEELQIEIINYKIKKVSKDIAKIKSSSMPFKDKVFKMRSLQNSLISMKKQQTNLLKISI